MADFKKTCPQIAINFMATVTTENVDTLQDLVTTGLEIGVQDFCFREVFYHPDNSIVDHERMKALVLRDNQFARAKERLIETFGFRAKMRFEDQSFLDAWAEKVWGELA